MMHLRVGGNGLSPRAACGRTVAPHKASDHSDATTCRTCLKSPIHSARKAQNR